MKFDELSNEEIAFIYLLSDDMLDAFNEVVANGGVKYVMDSPLGKVEIFKEFSPGELEDLKKNLKVQLLTSITHKLAPVLELIGESNQEVIDKVRDALFPETEEEKDED